MKPLKTLHVDSEMQWGGGQRQVAGLCSYLREQGHGVTVVCRPGSRLEAWAADSGCSLAVVEMKTATAVWALLKLRSLIHREAPDVVHLHSSRAHLFGSAAAKLAGAETVVATRRVQFPIRMSWPNTRVYGSWTTALVAISEAVKESMVADGVSATAIRIIESGVDVEKFAAASPSPSLRVSLGAQDAVPIVGAAATLTRIKGIDVLLEAAALLQRDGTPVHVLVAGDGEQRPELEELARRLRISASFPGFCENMPEIVALMDVFAAPSLSEGLGNAAIEAMAARKPVVASAVGGLKESVVDGETGFLVPPQDPAALSSAVGQLLADPALREKFGAAGQARARANYSLSTMARKYEALYYELIDR